jgi:branched-chain amino acid transport system substrate-binding protein
METGADANRFLLQWSNFGLKGKIPLIGSQNTTDQSVIRNLNDEAEGVISASFFAEGNPVPATQKFVAEYFIAHKQLPSVFGFTHYIAAVWLAKAITKLNGDIENRPKFLEAIKATAMEESPLGKPVRLDSYGNPIYDVFIRKVAKRSDGKYWNIPIDSYPNVSQFWTYKPEEYMKQPPYSRTFQGIKRT